MKILSMTATFGKLENQTLTLEPGLNILSAPNEWGKTTWCAFLATMLYGLDTREKTTKTTLAVKERYAPWSGSPMSGRMDLLWNGRAITIERWSKGRTPMGEFRAYETQSGLPVQKLTGANCGEMLLGVEKSVFLRAGFLRLSDLPVTADDSLRRRLNALVTTGDESGAADALAQKLKDLKNKCRANRTTGLIPQAEAEKTDTENKLRQLQQLQAQAEDVRRQQGLAAAQLADLENHALHLEYAAAEENNCRIAAAQDAARLAQLQLQTLAAQCQALPDEELANRKLHTLQYLQQKQQQARMDAQMLPPAPQAPGVPSCFFGCTGAEALAQAEADSAQYQAAATPLKKPFPLWIFGALAALAGLILLNAGPWIPGAVLLAAGAGLWLWHTLLTRRQAQASLAALTRQQAIASRYGGGTPSDWVAQAQRFARQQQEYDAAVQQHEAQRRQRDAAVLAADQALEDATDGMGLSAAAAYYTNAIRLHSALADAQKAYSAAQDHAQTVSAMAKPVKKPKTEDALPYSSAQTQQMLSEAHYQLQQLQTLLGQCQGRMDALGSEAALRRQLEAVSARLDKLTLYYNSLDTALLTLEKATAELQRRFAPRISQQAQEIFSKLTLGRYERLNLQQDLSVNAATAEDVALRSALWRSEGTVDQLYLSLRLAVARELTPSAPLVLDDALVRFDDQRHAAAMDVLRQEAQSKQVILFTCQSREQSGI